MKTRAAAATQEKLDEQCAWDLYAPRQAVCVDSVLARRGASGRVPTAQGKRGKWPQYSLPGKTQGFWKFYQNTGNLVCSSCKFPDSKVTRYFNICHKKIPLFLKSWISLPSQFCVWKSHKSRKLAQGKCVVGHGKKTRENTGNLKMQFEWVPCYTSHQLRPQHGRTGGPQLHCRVV